MVYLTYEEYKQMGGTLDDAAFFNAERKARQLINAQASGQTGERIGKLTELPQAVKDCIFDLISLFSSYRSAQISSESQTQGGISESVSYVTKTNEQLAAEADDIIFNSFYGGGVGGLLYRGMHEE